MSLLCDLVELPRSRFCYASQVLPDLSLREVMETVAVEFPRCDYTCPTIGAGRRMTVKLRWHHFVVNQKKSLRLTRENNLLAEVRRPALTINGQHLFGPYAKLLKKLVIAYPERAWVGDMTSVRL